MVVRDGAHVLVRQLGDERSGVVRLEAETPRDLLAGGPRPLGEQVAQELSCFWAAPPILADLVDEIGTQLRVPDPGAQIVRRIEARIHVREVTVVRIANARR